jgi:hypothetical protein
MNWDAISTIAEIIGVLAVVASLGYVSVQIRQNTQVARAATRQAISESTEALTSDLINNAEIAEIFVKHMNGEELSPVENLRLQARCYRDMAHWENIHYQFAEGMVSHDQWLGFRKNLAALLAIGAYREYWEHESFHYSNAFQAEVASIYEESKTNGAPTDIASRFRHTSGR